MHSIPQIKGRDNAPVCGEKGKQKGPLAVQEKTRQRAVSLLSSIVGGKVQERHAKRKVGATLAAETIIGRLLVAGGKGGEAGALKGVGRNAVLKGSEPRRSSSSWGGCQILSQLSQPH